jgi:hypothetical protein
VDLQTILEAIGAILTDVQALWFVLVEAGAEHWPAALLIFVLIGLLKAQGLLNDGNRVALVNLIAGLLAAGGLTGVRDYLDVADWAVISSGAAIFHKVWERYILVALRWLRDRAKPAGSTA